MAVLESRDYQAARERLKSNPVIAMMAVGVVAVLLAELAHEDGTPRSHLMSQANRAFDDAEARNVGNPAYQPYPAGARRRLGLIAEDVLAEHAAIREAVGGEQPVLLGVRRAAGDPVGWRPVAGPQAAYRACGTAWARGQLAAEIDRASFLGGRRTLTRHTMQGAH